ncbi:MAG: hypothetical protein GY953_49170, partial [bacterium]|nr:hypothetical protein [bacterium]
MDALSLFLAGLLAAPQALAQPADTAARINDWARVQGLRAGRRISIRTQDGARIKGTFVSASTGSIVIRNKRDVVQEIPKDQVRQVTAKRPKVRYAPLIGAARGALTLTYLTTRRGSDLVGS